MHMAMQMKSNAKSKALVTFVFIKKELWFFHLYTEYPPCAFAQGGYPMFFELSASNFELKSNQLFLGFDRRRFC